MNKTIKIIIIPIIVIILFSFVYFIIIPRLNKKDFKDTLFKDFEQGLANLGISYTRNNVDASEYGAVMAYTYMAEDKYIGLYYFGENSSEYNDGELNGYIPSKINGESYLYGVFKNNCVLFMEIEHTLDM